jgi:hypothetical protein
MSTLTLPAVTLSLVVALGACGADTSFSPTVDTVAGAYPATTFTVTTATGTTNLLASGATVSLTLAADGTMGGRLIVPAGAEDGGDLDADLAGGWVLKGSTVTFGQSADTFIRDLEFVASRNRLSGAGTFDGTTIRLVLTKVG